MSPGRIGSCIDDAVVEPPAGLRAHHAAHTPEKLSQPKFIGIRVTQAMQCN